MDECKPLGDGDGAVRDRHAPHLHHRALQRRALDAGGGAGLGEAVQVEPMKSKLKPPGTMRLKLRYDGPLSISAFRINLRRYSLVWENMNGMCYT